MKSIPRFGVGSKRCAGNEKRTEAMSATPANLVNRGLCQHPPETIETKAGICISTGRQRCGHAYFRRMERKVFSLEDSSGAFSGVVAVDDIAEATVDGDGANANGGRRSKCHQSGETRKNKTERGTRGEVLTEKISKKEEVEK